VESPSRVEGPAPRFLLAGQLHFDGREHARTGQLPRHGDVSRGILPIPAFPRTAGLGAEHLPRRGSRIRRREPARQKEHEGARDLHFAGARVPRLGGAQSHRQYSVRCREYESNSYPPTAMGEPFSSPDGTALRAGPGRPAQPGHLAPQSTHGAVPQSAGVGVGERQRRQKRREGERPAGLPGTGARDGGREPLTRGGGGFPRRRSGQEDPRLDAQTGSRGRDWPDAGADRARFVDGD